MNPAAAIALSGLTAASLKLDVSASNLVSAQDEVRVGAAPAFQPLAIVQSPAPGGGVVATAVTLKSGPLIVFDPASPAANAQGLVQAPEIDPIAQIAGQLAGSQAFAFSLEALKVADEMDKSLLDLKA